jgi:stage V sporulation protein D (sporulation-specific penicillin-binding protein)
MENNHIVSFIGFAPADDPQIVVYLAIDNPKGTVQFGGVVAAPVVGNIMEESLSALGVEKRKGQIEKELQWPDVPLVEVPDLKGMSRKELVQQLITLKLDISGEGDVVVEQAPKPGTKVKEGSTIRVYMSGSNKSDKD